MPSMVGLDHWNYSSAAVTAPKLDIYMVLEWYANILILFYDLSWNINGVHVITGYVRVEYLEMYEYARPNHLRCADS